eukprot:411187_1
MASSSNNNSQPALSTTKSIISFYILRELASSGATNAIASFCLNPMDVTKVRMQTESALSSSTPRIYKTFTGTAIRILREEGILGLWLPGMVPSMIRELSYGSLRMGLYTPIRSFFMQSLNMNKNGDDIGLTLKILSGLTTGAIGSAIFTPTDIIKIRFQQEAGRINSDGIYITGSRKGHPPQYKHTIDALYSIYNKHGFAGLYKGCTPTVVRAALITAGQLSTYDHTKYTIKKHGLMDEGVPLHIVASLVSGFAATTACAPADLVKTRIMCDPYKELYKNPVDCAIKTVRYDGLFALFRGWVPSYVRVGPHFIIAFPLLEQMRKLFGLGWFATN